jgi:hypothetical protein
MLKEERPHCPLYMDTLHTVLKDWPKDGVLSTQEWHNYKTRSLLYPLLRALNPVSRRKSVMEALPEPLREVIAQHYNNANFKRF